MGAAGAVSLPGQALPTFHGKVYVARKARKSSDLPGSMTNASAAQRRIISPDDAWPVAAKSINKVKPKKVVQKRISSSGDELQNQIDAGWVDVNLSLMAVTDLIHFAKKVTAGTADIRTLKLECFPKEYDRLEAEARKHQTKPKYSLAAPEHTALAKSTAELMCHPQLKGKVASAIKEVLMHGAALEELVIGMHLPAVIWKALCSSLGSHQSLHTLSLAGSGIGDSTLQVLLDGLRANQTLSELDLSGCNLTDDGVKMLASLIKAKAAEADVQEWHEGLREYPDLSLAPGLRRRQFRARNQEIRGRVLARCGGLQVLNLAENKITDAGAQVLLDSLVMDRGMMLLDLSSNQLTARSGKASGRLMQKHKGLLRIDLRNNASGFSGVLQMLPKQSISAAKSLKNTNASNLAEPSHAEAAVGISNHSTAAQQTYLGSDAAKAAAVTSRKGLTPVMTTDGHTPLQLEEPDPGDQSEKENSQCSQVAKQPRKGRSKAGHGPAAAGKPPCKAKRAKQACTARSEFLEFEFAAQPQHADDPSTTSSDFLEFGFTSQHELQFQPSDDLTGIGNAEKVQQEPTHTASQQGWYPPVTAVANDMAGSASFGLWARSQHEGAQPNAAEPNTVQSVAAVRLHQHTAADSNAQFDSSMSHEGSTNPASTYDMPPVRYSARVESPHGEDFLAHDQMQTEDQQGLRQQSHLAANPVQYTSAVQDEVMEPTCLNASTCWGCQQHQAAVTSATARGPTSTGNAASAVHSSKGRLGACQPMSATPGRQASVQPLSTSAGKQASLQPVTAAVGRQASTQPMSTSAGRQAPVQPGAAQQRQAAQGLQQTSAESRAGDLRWNSEQPITVWPGHHAVDVFTAQLAGFADPSTGPLKDERSKARWTEQAAGMAAAPAEAAKLHEWKAELLGKMKTLRSSVQASMQFQPVYMQDNHLQPDSVTGISDLGPSDADRTETRVAEVQQHAQSLSMPARPPAQQHYHRQKVPGKRRKKVCKANLTSRNSKAQLADQTFDAMLYGQERMLGELNQVMQSLDHLVTDIEHARGSAEREQCHGEALSDLQGMNDTSQDLTVGAMYMSGKRYAVDSALADITAQLSSQYDLHDTW